MKKIMALIVAVTTILIIGGCSQVQDVIGNQASSANSLATLSYVSSSFLDTEKAQEPTASTPRFMSNHGTTELESELNNVNKYVDKLKVFIENGTGSFGDIEVLESDNEMYNNKIVFTITETEYVLYYNVDNTDGTIVGEFIIGDTTYSIEGYTNFNDVDDIDFEDPDDDDDAVDTENDDDDDAINPEDIDGEDLNEGEEDEEENTDDEDEEKMVLIAKNGEDIIRITYKVEAEDDEFESKFELEQTINGVYSEVTLKIEQEEDEYKVEIEDGTGSYTFKRELEDNNEVEYKLEYEVNGVEGEVKITETVNQAGETVYVYEIEEDGQNVTRDSDDDDDNIEDDDENSAV